MSASRKPRPTTAAKLDKYRRRYGEIIDAAAAVFAEKGYHGSSTKDIADRLGIRQGSLYYYFASKEAALEEVCQKGVEGYVQGVEDIIASGAQPAEQIRAAVRAHLEPLRSRYDYVRVFLGDRDKLAPRSRRKIGVGSRLYERRLEEIFAAGVASGAFRRDLDCRLATLALLGMCNSVAAWYRKESGVTLEAIAAAYGGLVMDGVAAKRPRRG
jgi:AcrR family transcriptional regulator